ncbi:Hydrolase, TatD family [Shewanella piezotolerans WP3]|uniref:Hydrolase, TatD family n=1 Tax=Shewanella piezotolerans (strain WP3 / JCM 13877) TaxID=225849 RepID=B8CKI1_SHEPW|nr:TatD family hydrolase [Shewanella piezotolerans]ACJ28020.1 Hydrolase, TatD family [Shewanella piezotolerans WP3]
MTLLVNDEQFKIFPMIDSHAHLDFSEFDHDRGELFQQMRDLGVEQVVIPGVSEDKWANQVRIAKQFDCPFALGIHPWFCHSMTNQTLANLRELLLRSQQDEKLVAIGECGLDKLHKSNFATQLSVFKAQILLAEEFELPLIIHCVKSHEEMLNLLKVSKNVRKGVIHGFYGGPELASRYVHLGYKLGIGGLLLNDNAHKLQQTVAELPLSAFVLETDSPAMRPQNSDSDRNSPLILPLLLKKMASLQKKTNVLISEQLYLNVSQLFDL